LDCWLKFQPIHTCPARKQIGSPTLPIGGWHRVSNVNSGQKKCETKPSRVARCRASDYTPGKIVSTWGDGYELRSNFQRRSYPSWETGRRVAYGLPNATANLLSPPRPNIESHTTSTVMELSKRYKYAYAPPSWLRVDWCRTRNRSAQGGGGPQGAQSENSAMPPRRSASLIQSRNPNTCKSYPPWKALAIFFLPFGMVPKLQANTI
jgi:hypothetical protein